MEKAMKIGIIGGGKRCRAFLEMFDAMRFPQLGAEIVAVADPDLEAPGIRLARERNIFVTTDYEDLYEIRNLDLVIELTGKEDLLEDFLRHKPARVRVLESAISRIFGDVLRLSEEYQFAKCRINLVEGIVDSLFMGLRDWVVVMQTDRKLVDANEAFLTAVRKNKDDIVGKHCHEIAYGTSRPCNREGFYCPVARCIETGEAAVAILEGAGGPGLGRYQEITAVPLKIGGRIELVVEIFRDITDEMEKKVEQKVSALKEDLMRLVYEEKMISLGKMAASAVHEINNPLSGINSLARLVRQELESGKTDEASRERFIYYLGLIDSESARCSGIVRDLLHFSRQSRGIRSEFQVNGLIERVLDFVRFRLDSQEIKVKTELAPALPLMIGDQSQIEQCLLNLIFNAADAMPDGGELVLRTSSVGGASPMIRVEVIDTGAGIAEEIIPSIFEPFFSTKSHDKGVGLGLSVVYGIVKEHGGSVFVKSKEGAGSRFILKFPVESGNH